MGMTLYKRLRSSQIECSLNRSEFLPNSVVIAEITRENVKAELSASRWKRVLERNLPGEVVNKASRTFAILVLIGEAQAIRDLLKEGVNDTHLPLSRNISSSNDSLVSADGKRMFSCFASWRNESRVSEFLDKQWLVLAPVLQCRGEHVKVDSKSALPFQGIREIGRGQFSVVYRGELHLSHQRDFEVLDGRIQVAIKEFEIEGAESFLQEKGHLERIRDIDHPHLIRYLTSFEIGERYYFIFPWADGGNLRQYWKDQDSSERTADLALWCLEQMCGLAEALAILHEKKRLRHGDLKPDNILYFQYSTRKTLVIADMGVSRFHREETRFRQAPTTSTATTPSYEAPEVYTHIKEPRSRKYDMWSLGCIFLEFTIWFLYGFDSIDNFSQSRESFNSPSYFYNQLREGTAEIHPRVSEALEEIKQNPRCRGDTALNALIALVSDNLLCIEVDQRDEANQALEKLKLIVNKARSNHSYLLNHGAEPSSKPTIFGPHPKYARQTNTVILEETTDGKIL